jgi:electron transfer flavoprotein beta subunit
MKALKIIVLVKQVPDTRNLGSDAMKPDGTVNRAKIPTIFNPDDLSALEMALSLKDQIPGTQVTVLTMGPPKAADIMRDSLYRGADKAIMISDRRFGGADTLATSYTIAQAIRKIGDYDIIMGGRQAIDGDTAQVGPQTAEKLGLPQVTYAVEIINIDNDKITIKRRLDKGIEIVESPLPLLMTVHGSAPQARMPIAKRVMKYKYARSKTEMKKADDLLQQLHRERPYLTIEEWNVEDINADPNKIGLPGSPTKVKSIENVVFTTTESKVLTGSYEDVESVIKDLLEHHTIG